MTFLTCHLKKYIQRKTLAKSLSVQEYKEYNLFFFLLITQLFILIFIKSTKQNQTNMSYITQNSFVAI